MSHSIGRVDADQNPTLMRHPERCPNGVQLSLLTFFRVLFTLFSTVIHYFT